MVGYNIYNIYIYMYALTHGLISLYKYKIFQIRTVEQILLIYSHGIPFLSTYFAEDSIPTCNL